MIDQNSALRIAKNSLFQGAAFVAEGLAELMITFGLARLAGTERLGEFATLISLAGLFAFISAYGLPGLLTREIARLREDKTQIARLTNAAVGLVAALSILTVLLMALLGMVSGYSTILLKAVILTGIALGFESMAMVVAATFRGVEDLQTNAVITAVMHLAFLVLAFAVILFNARIDWLMAAYLASRLIALVAAAWLYQPRFGKLYPVIDRKLCAGLLKTGLPFSVNSVFSYAYSRADVVILSYLAGNVVVGFYNLAYSLTMRMNILARALTFALYPFLSFQFVKNEQAMRAYAAKGIRILIIPGFLIATMLWLFGHEFLFLLFGEKIADAASNALRALALAIPLRFIETALGVALDASNRSGKRAVGVTIAAIVNVLLNLMLIPQYQIMGAVYATLITEVVICGLFIWYLRDGVRELIEWRAFVGPGLGVVVMLSAPFLLNPINLWLLIVLSVCFYTLTVVAVDRFDI